MTKKRKPRSLARKVKRELDSAGRPTKLTPERHAAIVDGLRKGTPEYSLAYKQGIHPDTLRKWRLRGDSEAREGLDSIYTRFFWASALAEAEWEERAVESIISDPKGHRGLQWYLERRNRDRYGAAPQVAVGVKVELDSQPAATREDFIDAMVAQIEERRAIEGEE